MVFLDIETTGITTDDRICACGVIYEELHQYELCNNGRKITPMSSSVHHITNEMVADKKPFEQTKTYALLQQWNDDGEIFVFHNGDFTLSMLSSHNFFPQKFIDTKRVAQHLIEDCESYSLGFLRYECKLYQKEAQEVAPTALGDAYVVQLLFEYLKELVSVEKMCQLSVEPVILQKFSFGKYKGSYIEEVMHNDRGYIEWLLNQEDLYEDLRYSLEYYLGV